MSTNVTPDKARALLRGDFASDARQTSVGNLEANFDSFTGAHIAGTPGDFALTEEAGELAELAASMHYEYAVQNAETGTWLREESDGVVVHTSDPLAADWGTDLEEAKSYAVWITGEKLTEYRVMGRLATDPEVVE